MVHTYHERTRALRQVEERRPSSSDVFVTRKTNSGGAVARIRRSPSTSTRISVRHALTGGRADDSPHASRLPARQWWHRARMVGLRHAHRRTGRDRDRHHRRCRTQQTGCRGRGRRRLRGVARGDARRRWTSNARISSACRTAAFSRSNQAARFPNRVASLTLLDPAGLAPIKLGQFIRWGMTVMAASSCRAPCERVPPAACACPQSKTIA